ncbi:MAG: S24 family peptidase [Patescibacteria group bacterium]|nr:S24 family peptidase [Patescibacteria group bacterium]
MKVLKAYLAKRLALTSKPSMSPRFPKGTVFIIDKQEPPRDGDLVLVKIKDSEGLTLRDLMVDPPQWRLQPVVQGSEPLVFAKGRHEVVGVVMMTLFHAQGVGI